MPVSSTPANLTPELWATLSPLFDQALELEGSDQRRFIDELAARHPELAQELVALLGAANARQPIIAPTLDDGFTLLLNEALEAKSDTPLRAGQTLGQWQLERLLGRGGMGEVWLASRNDGLYQGQAAIKLLRTDLPAERLAARFARERSVLARLNHPNIARLLDAGVAEQHAYLVLEYVDGLPLLDYVRQQLPSLNERVRLLRDIARAVEHAHSQWVLHRDLKPSNVLVTADGTVKLLDFGIAAAIDDAVQDDTGNLTQLTGRGLTLEYAAPEQITGDRTVAASDVYSLGVILFQLIAGERPFEKNGVQSRSALEYAVVHQEPPRLSAVLRQSTHGAVSPLSHEQRQDVLPRPSDVKRAQGDLEAIVAKALRTALADRYPSATALAIDLDAWLQQAPISIRRDDRRYRLQLWLRRNWPLATAGSVALLAVTAGLGISLWQRQLALKAAEEARAETQRTVRVAQYLGELLQSANPDEHNGAWPSVLQLLERSEQEVAAKFADDPKTYALLLEHLQQTNSALNRNDVALAQTVTLIQQLEAQGEHGSRRWLDAQTNRALILGRMNRLPEAIRTRDAIKTQFGQHYGVNSYEYMRFLQQHASLLGTEGRFGEARATLTEATQILPKLNLPDVETRVDSNYDIALLLTNQARWNEARTQIDRIMTDLPAYAELGGSYARNALVMRLAWATIHTRVGQFEGVEQATRTMIADADQRLGPGNNLGASGRDLLVVLLCETGRFSECTAQSIENERLASQQSHNASTRYDAAISKLQLETSYAALQPALVQQRWLPLFEQLAQHYPEATRQRIYYLRLFADIALTAGLLDEAERALMDCERDIRAIALDSPERLGQFARAQGALNYAKGDIAIAIKHLKEREKYFLQTEEGDTPRHAGLLIQLAMYAAQHDKAISYNALKRARDMFQRIGQIPPQHVAFMRYVDALLSQDTAARQTAEAELDRIYLRDRNRKNNNGGPWRPPHVSSL